MASHIPHPDPDQARRLRARADRRGPRPLRAQGPADHRRCGCSRRDEEIANRHYAEHTEKPFFGELVAFITGGPLVAAVLEGHEAVAAARQLIGATNPIEAAPGSIRGDFALEVTFNLVHGSDSDESAEREIAIWFGPSALILASASPRRREILDRLGIEFEVVVPEVEELGEGEPGGGRARERAPQGARRARLAGGRGALVARRSTPTSRSTAGCSARPATRRGARARSRRSRAGPTRS